MGSRLVFIFYLVKWILLFFVVKAYELKCYTEEHVLAAYLQNNSMWENQQ